MAFKIVATRNRRGGTEIALCPSAWESNGILMWPLKNISCLQRDAESEPEKNWASFACTVKKTDIQTYDEALDWEKAFQTADTDEEAELTLPQKFNKKSKGVTKGNLEPISIDQMMKNISDSAAANSNCASNEDGKQAVTITSNLSVATVATNITSRPQRQQLGPIALDPATGTNFAGKTVAPGTTNITSRPQRQQLGPNVIDPATGTNFAGKTVAPGTTNNTSRPQRQQLGPNVIDPATGINFAEKTYLYSDDTNNNFNNNGHQTALMHINNTYYAPPASMDTNSACYQGGSVNSSLYDDLPVLQLADTEVASKLQMLENKIETVLKEVSELKHSFLEYRIQHNTNNARIFTMLEKISQNMREQPKESVEAAETKDQTQTRIDLKKFPLPINNLQELKDFDKELKFNPEYFDIMEQHFSEFSGTDGQGRGEVLGRKMAEQVMTRSLMTTMSWTGVSRTAGQEKKFPFQSLDSIIKLFYNVMLKADSRWTNEKNEKLFSCALLKHAKKRAQAEQQKKEKRPTKVQTSNIADINNPEPPAESATEAGVPEATEGIAEAEAVTEAAEAEAVVEAAEAAAVLEEQAIASLDV